MSRDLIGAAVYLAIFSVITFSAGGWITGLIVYLRTSFSTAHQPGGVSAHLLRALDALKDATLAPLVAATALAVGVGFMQSGGLFSFEALKLDPQKVMPSLKKVFSLSSLMEVVKGFVKITLAGSVAWYAVKPLLGSLVNLTG